jgi:DnaK suppressor protein
MAAKKQKPAAKRKGKATTKASKTTKAKAKSKTVAKKKPASKAKKTVARTKAKAKVTAKNKVKAKVPVVTKKKTVTKKTTIKAKSPTKTPKKTTKAAPAKTAKKSTPQPTKKTKPATKRKPVPRKGAKSDQDFVPYTPRKNEEYMNTEQKDHFRDILLVWKYQLMEEVDRTVNHMQEEAANYPDPADRASQEEEFSLELKTRDRERRLIRKIDSTIELIEQDDYGYCESCGVEIGIGRLEARPTATLCIDCKTLAEIREKQIRG